MKISKTKLLNILRESSSHHIEEILVTDKKFDFRVTGNFAPPKEKTKKKGWEMNDKTLALLEKMNESIIDIQKDINQKFEAIDQKIEAMDQKFEAMDQKFEAMDQKFEAMDQKFEVINKKIDTMDQKFTKRFDVLETKVDKIISLPTVNREWNEKFKHEQ